MRIVLFDLNRLSFEGGAEKYLNEVGIELSKKKHEVIYVGDFRFILYLYIFLGLLLLVNSPRKLVSLCRELHKSPSIKPGTEKYFTVYRLSLRFLLPSVFSRSNIKNILQNADAVLVKNEIAELCCLRLMGVNTPKVFTMVFSSLYYPQANSFRTKLHNRIYCGKFYQRQIKKFPRIIVSNKNDEIYFKKLLGRRSNSVHYLPYGLDESYFLNSNEVKTTRGFNILFVGRLEEQKGIDYLKRIIEKVNSRKDDNTINFTLAGDGPLKPTIETIAKKYSNVSYLGQVNKDDLRSTYLKSDLVIIPSKWETFSYVCLEAQACGVPVVAFDIPGPQDILRYGTGKLIPLGNINQFSNAIEHFINLKIKSNTGYLKVRHKIADQTARSYSIDTVVKQLERLAVN